jgi:Bacterial Ig-like domain
LLQSFEALRPRAGGVKFVRDGATCGLQLLQSHAEFFDGHKPLAANYWCPARMRSASAWTTVKVDTFMLGKGKLSASQLTSATRIGSETTVSYEPTTQTATLDPYGSTTSRLAKCQRYTAKLTSRVKDKAGNPAIEKIWQFKTLC